MRIRILPLLLGKRSVVRIVQGFHAVKQAGPANRKGPDAEIGFLSLSAENNRSHADVELLHPDSAAPCHRVMTEFMPDHDHRKDDQKNQNADNHAALITCFLQILWLPVRSPESDPASD